MRSSVDEHLVSVVGQILSPKHETAGCGSFSFVFFAAACRNVQSTNQSNHNNGYVHSDVNPEGTQTGTICANNAIYTQPQCHHPGTATKSRNFHLHLNQLLLHQLLPPLSPTLLFYQPLLPAARSKAKLKKQQRQTATPEKRLIYRRFYL